MKKKFGIVMLTTLVLGIALFNVTSSAQAYSSLAEEEWSTGTEVEVDLDETTAPDWLQLLTEGVVIDEPATICHEFGGAQFYWVGQIRMLQNDEWVKVNTTVAWEPNDEGVIMACTYATKAGTYALFGYYDYEAAAEAAEAAAEE